MRDRISTYPGRVRLIPVSGQTNVYDMIREDEPTEIGTGLVKANLLSDEVAESLGLDPADNPTVNDAFARIKELIGQGGGSGGSVYYDAIIGDVVYSAIRPSPSTDWLECNGNYFDATEYPELANYLSKTDIGGYEAVVISKEDIGPTISNGVVYNSYYWVYSHNYNNSYILYGYPLAGGSKKTIQLTFADSNISTYTQYPIALSIAGGKLFLSQIRTNNISSGITLLTSENNFTGNESRINLVNVFSSYGENAAIYGNRGNVIPYVVKNGNYFYMCVGPNPKENVYYWFWESGAASPQISTVSLGANIEYKAGYYLSVAGGGYGKLAFNKKNDNNMFVSQVTNRYSGSNIANGYYYSTVESVPNGYSEQVSQSNGKVTITGKQYSFRNNSNITPIKADSDVAIVDVGISDGNMQFNLNNNGILEYAIVGTDYIPQNANLKYFPDAASYFANEDVWIIFVGNGFIFSKDLLDATNYGFADTSRRIGLIRTFGHMELDPSNQSRFFISGINNNDEFVLASFNIQGFTGSKTSPFLPYLVDNNDVPGWIRAKVTKTETPTVEQGEV